MTFLSAVIRPLYGTLFLARFKNIGFRYLGSSIPEFWQSFSAAAIILPFFIVLVIIRFDNLGIPDGFLRYLGLDLCSYTLSWLIFPLLMIKLTQFLDCEKHFIKFLIAYNWSMVPQNILYILIILLGSNNIISNTITTKLVFLLLIWSFAFTWFVIREVLMVTSIKAIAIVIINFLLNLIVEAAINLRY